jgi:hypothetical protein
MSGEVMCQDHAAQTRAHTDSPPDSHLMAAAKWEGKQANPDRARRAQWQILRRGERETRQINSDPAARLTAGGWNGEGRGRGERGGRKGAPGGRRRQ